MDPNCRKSSFVGGDVIEGEVFLDVVHDGFKADTLSLLFSGGEKTLTHYTTKNGKQTIHHNVRRSRDLVLT